MAHTKRILRTAVSLLVVLALGCRTLAMAQYGEAVGDVATQEAAGSTGTASAADTSGSGIDGTGLPSYSEMLSQTATQPYAGREIRLSAGELQPGSGTGQDATPVIVRTGEATAVTVNVPQTALYYIQFIYKDLTDNMLPVQMSVRVNGSFPFRELSSVTFENRWYTPAEKSYDRYGNEIVVLPEKDTGWQEKYLMDASYRRSSPLYVELQQGENRLEFTGQEGSMEIRELVLTGDWERVQSSGQEADGVPDGEALVTVEGEDILWRNDSSIRAGSEFDSGLTPYDSKKKVLNMLDGASFYKAGQTVAYSLTVSQTGYYYLALDCRQNGKVDFPVFLDIAVDGRIPDDRLAEYPLDYSRKFSTTILTREDGSPVAVYLEAGEHTLSLTISVERLLQVVEELDRISDEMNDLALEITRLVGNSVNDQNRDFDIDRYIPGVSESLNRWISELEALNAKAAELSGEEKSGTFSQLRTAIRQLKSLAEDYDELPTHMQEFSVGSGSVVGMLSTQLETLLRNDVSLDTLYLFQQEDSLPQGKNLFQRIWDAIVRFFVSFTGQDYSAQERDEESLQVWVNRPRQYVEIMQNMIDAQYTPQSGVRVKLSLMPDQNKLTLANAAGKAPDAATGVQYVMPSELAMRGALKPLNEFEGFEETIGRVPQGLLVPSMIGDQVYAIPETMDFWLMFYRKDILEALGLGVPQDIEELKDMLPVLQRRGMNFYYPTSQTPAAMKIFAGTMPFIYQYGGAFYDENIERTTLNSEAALQGITELTDLFCIYNLPVEVPSFYQGFRNGTLPIGVADYATYNQLLNAAPEIQNQWGLALFPGVRDENGVVQRWTTGGAESCIIFNSSQKQQEAWDFLRWWNSTEIQSEFSQMLQAAYGTQYLWCSANLEAFAQAPWKAADKEVILEQARWMIEPPRLPGTYMLERELSNAYDAIVQNGTPVRTAVDEAVKRINRETMAKLEEFGYAKNGEILKQYPLPQIQVDPPEEAQHEG